MQDAVAARHLAIILAGCAQNPTSHCRTADWRWPACAVADRCDEGHGNAVALLAATLADRTLAG